MGSDMQRRGFGYNPQLTGTTSTTEKIGRISHPESRKHNASLNRLDTLDDSEWNEYTLQIPHPLKCRKKYDAPTVSKSRLASIGWLGLTSN